MEKPSLRKNMSWPGSVVYGDKVRSRQLLSKEKRQEKPAVFLFLYWKTGFAHLLLPRLVKGKFLKHGKAVLMGLAKT